MNALLNLLTTVLFKDAISICFILLWYKKIIFITRQNYSQIKAVILLNGSKIFVLELKGL